ncbi:MAG: hypothetical protein Q9195_003817 [Heterodermia aff. obscurata]
MNPYISERKEAALRPEVLTELLTSSIDRVKQALQFAYEDGHRSFETQSNDTGIATTYHACLTGCSDQSYELILRPLQDVHQQLESYESSLKGWANRAKRMQSKRAVVSTWPLISQPHGVGSGR